MALVQEPRRACDVDSAGASLSWSRRLWRLPLWAHAVALTAVLIALLAVVGTTTSSTSDEGLAIIQARSLAEGDGWIVEHPLPGLDPDGSYYPVEKALRGPNGFAPLPKHPLYPLLLAAAGRLGGVAGMVLFSVAGVVVASALSGVLAARIRPELGRPALWVVGLASPLTHDGYLVFAHTLAAALTAAAVLVAAIAFERRSVRHALLVAPLVGGAALLRSEALFLAVGLAVAGIVLAARRRRVGIAVAGASGGAAVAATLGERAWVGAILGRGMTGVSVPAGGGDRLLGDRFEGFLLTWLTPSYERSVPVVVGLLVMVAALMIGAWCVRRREPRRRPLLVAAVLAPLAAVVAFAAAPGNRVPGLLVAFPVLAAAIVLVRRVDVAATEARMATMVAAVFAPCVIATQYSVGGGVEWGGRYFALALPIAVPVALAALQRHGRRLAPTPRRAAVASLAACSVLMTTMGLTSLRESHDAKVDLVAAIDRSARATAAPRPIVLTTAFSISALAWPTFDRYGWLYARPGDLDVLVRRMQRSGVRTFVLVTRTEARDRDIAPPVDVLAAEMPAPGLHVLTLGVRR